MIVEGNILNREVSEESRVIVKFLSNFSPLGVIQIGDDKAPLSIWTGLARVTVVFD